MTRLEPNMQNAAYLGSTSHSRFNTALCMGSQIVPEHTKQRRRRVSWTYVPKVGLAVPVKHCYGRVTGRQRLSRVAQ